MTFHSSKREEYHSYRGIILKMVPSSSSRQLKTINSFYKIMIGVKITLWYMKINILVNYCQNISLSTNYCVMLSRTSLQKTRQLNGDKTQYVLSWITQGNFSEHFFSCRKVLDYSCVLSNKFYFKQRLHTLDHDKWNGQSPKKQKKQIIQ